MKLAHRLPAIIIGTLPLLGLPAPASAADILVPQDAATIQAAIDLAASGDRVLVAPGTYAERVDFSGKDIVIESTDGAEATVIDGGGQDAGAGHVVVFAGGETRAAVLRGFTVTGGFGSGGSFGEGEGGGILIDGSGPLIEACIIAGNLGIDGGGLEARSGDARVVATVFRDNRAILGGGLYAEGGRITVERSDFLANVGGNNGGGMALYWDTEAVLTELLFEENYSLQFGGGLYAIGVDLDASWLTLRDNGLVEPTDDGVGQVFRTLGGGGMYVKNMTGRLDASRFEANNGAFGGGAYIAGGSEEFTVSNTLFARSNGTGALYFNAASPHVVNCTVASDGQEFALSTFSTFNALPVLKNTILEGTPGGSGEARLEYCLVDGSAGVGIVGEGTIFAASDLDPDNDYSPRPGSAAIDAGNNFLVPDGAVTDVLGNARFFDDPGTPDTGLGDPPIVDIGAVEFGSGVADPDGVTAAGQTPAPLLQGLRVAPNPFNPRTEIRFALERPAHVEIDLHDARGRRVATLRPGPLAAGPRTIPWSGTDRDGRALASGIYLAVVRADDQRQTVKMTLMR